MPKYSTDMKPTITGEEVKDTGFDGRHKRNVAESRWKGERQEEKICWRGSGRTKEHMVEGRREDKREF